VNDSFLEFIREQFSVLGPILVKRMFGGAGIYFDGVMFGLIADDVVYLKVDESNRKDYENAEMGPFIYDGKKKPVQMPYYQLPEDVLEDQDLLKEWSLMAVAVAKKSDKKDRQ